MGSFFQIYVALFALSFISASACHDVELTAFVLFCFLFFSLCFFFVSFALAFFFSSFLFYVYYYLFYCVSLGYCNCLFLCFNFNFLHEKLLCHHHNVCVGILILRYFNA